MPRKQNNILNISFLVKIFFISEKIPFFNKNARLFTLMYRTVFQHFNKTILFYCGVHPHPQTFFKEKFKKHKQDKQKNG